MPISVDSWTQREPISLMDIKKVPMKIGTLSGKRDSNSRPRPWQGRALPTELFPHYLLERRKVSFLYLRPESNRHARNGHRILSPARLPIPPLRHLSYLYKKSRLVSGFERKTRLELATPTLARSCSTN